MTRNFQVPDGYLDHLGSLSRELESKMNRVRSLIEKAHWGEEGSYKESILRELLRQIIPKRYSVSTGFIYWWDQGVSRQIDIIIWDSINHSPILLDGEFVIVGQESVRAIIEVKSKLTTSNFKTAISQLFYSQLIEFSRISAPTIIEGKAIELFGRIDPDMFRAVFYYNGAGLKTKKSKDVCFHGMLSFYRGFYSDPSFRKEIMTQSGTSSFSLHFPNLLNNITVLDEVSIDLVTGRQDNESIPLYIARKTRDNDLQNFGNMHLGNLIISLLSHLNGYQSNDDTSTTSIFRNQQILEDVEGVKYLHFGRYSDSLRYRSTEIEPDMLLKIKDPLW